MFFITVEQVFIGELNYRTVFYWGVKLSNRFLLGSSTVEQVFIGELNCGTVFIGELNCRTVFIGELNCRAVFYWGVKLSNSFLLGS